MSLAAMIEMGVGTGRERLGSWGRRRLRAGCLLLAFLLLQPAAARATHQGSAGSVLVFGDSYSARTYAGVTNWVEQLRQAQTIVVRGNFAQATATAANQGARTFATQLASWVQAGQPLADTTFVYFGYNDIYGNLPAERSRADHVRGIDQLIRAGAASGTRRIMLVLIHDWSRSPGAVGNERARVKAWNQHVRSVADARRNVGVADLFSEFEAVFARPGRFGFSNVTTPDPVASASTHLFYDPFHFGMRGQAIIASRMRAVLLSLRAAVLAAGPALRPPPPGLPLPAPLGLAFLAPAAGPEACA